MYSSALWLLSLAPVVLRVQARPASCKNGKAIYLSTNKEANAVIAVQIGQDGLLQGPGTLTMTGGAGANGITGSTKQPAAPDALFSQSALTVVGSHVFVVNAGSNTVSMLSIDRNDPTKLATVGQPAAIPGEFPVTVAASAQNKLVCVGTTGAKAGVSCAPFSAGGLGAMDGLRAFDIGQSTPPVGPTNTVSQVFFSSDGSTLFSTVKGDPTKNNTGFLAAFPVEEGGSCGTSTLGQKPILSSPSGTAVLFGSVPIPGSSDLFVTDASFGGAVLNVSEQDIAATVGRGVIDGQKATCWATISPATKTAFVADVATNRLVEMSLADASIQGKIDLSNGDPGLIDLVAAGAFVYALSPGNGTTQPAVTVVNAISKQQVQHLQLGDLGVDKNAQGMALLA